MKFQVLLPPRAPEFLFILQSCVTSLPGAQFRLWDLDLLVPEASQANSNPPKLCANVPSEAVNLTSCAKVTTVHKGSVEIGVARKILAWSIVLP